MSLKLKMLWGGDPHTPHFSLEILPIFEVSRLASMSSDSVLPLSILMEVRVLEHGTTLTKDESL